MTITVAVAAVVPRHTGVPQVLLERLDAPPPCLMVVQVGELGRWLAVVRLQLWKGVALEVRQTEGPGDAE